MMPQHPPPHAPYQYPPPPPQHQHQHQQQIPPPHLPPQQQQPPPPYMMMMHPPQAAQAPPPPLHHHAPMWAPQQSQQPPTGGSDEVRTLWIGDLQYYMDENFLAQCFAPTGEVASVKVIRNKQTGQCEGYGFIEFMTRATAEKVLQTYNGTPMPYGDQVYRLNWAASGGGKKHDDTPDYTIFVGDLSADVTDFVLQETFRARYPSVKGAKIVMDRLTGRSKGYGFVKFGDETDQIRAMTEMNGVFCSSRPMRIGPATNNKSQQYSKTSFQNPQGNQNETDPNNTTIFVGNLDSNVTDEHLRQLFSRCGELVHVKIPVGKRCGFVQFSERSCAEEALHTLNGTQMGEQNIRLSWGRSPSNKETRADPNQGSGGYYGYAPGYEAYGYAATPQDPSMYYGGYAGNGAYPQPAQQT